MVRQRSTAAPAIRAPNWFKHFDGKALVNFQSKRVAEVPNWSIFGIFEQNSTSETRIRIGGWTNNPGQGIGGSVIIIGESQAYTSSAGDRSAWSESGTLIVTSKQKQVQIHSYGSCNKNPPSVVHDTLIARRTRNLIIIFVREIGHSLPLDFESLPSSNNFFVALSKDKVGISCTAFDLAQRGIKVRS